MKVRGGFSHGPSSALIVVDVQNDFADPAGSLFVDGGDEIVELINAEMAACKTAGGHVVLTQDWHPPQTPHFADFGGVWPVHCVRDTWGAELHRSLAPGDVVVRKGTGGEDGYSGFTMRDPESGVETGTELEDILRGRDVTDVVVVGLALDVCVKATALDAVSKGFRTVVLADQSRGVELADGDTERAVAEMTAAGVTVI